VGEGVSEAKSIYWESRMTRKKSRKKSRGTNGIVQGYFERMDGGVLGNYATTVKSVIHGHAGVYPSTRVIDSTTSASREISWGG